MAKIIESQDVKLFTDETMIGKQEVYIQTQDPCGPWMSVTHDGNEISLSVENWNKLVELAEKAKSQIIK